MAFWSDTSTESNDPKRQYRFVVDIGEDIVRYVIKKTDKPSFAISEAEHKYLNHTYYYPGRVSWNAINITLVDQGGPDDTAYNLSSLIEDAGYKPQEAEASLATMSKKSAVGKLGHVMIQQLDSAGKVIEKWTLKNAWINDVKYGDLAYDGDDLTELTISVRYDWAELDAGGDLVWKVGAGSRPPR